MAGYTVYIIIYSIVMLLTVAASVGLCLIYVYNSKKQLQKKAEQAAAAVQDNTLLHYFMGEDDDIAVVIMDGKTGCPMYISEGVKHFFGVKAEEMYRDTSVIKDSIDRQYMRKLEQGLRNWDRTQKLEMEFAYGDNQMAKVNGYPVDSGDQQCTAFVIFDITEQKKTIADMQEQLNAALIQAAAKSSFLSSMSHEIRTPMNGIMGMLSLARMNIADTEKVLNYLERAGDLSLFLLGIINDVLDISKIESGKMQIYNSQFDILAFADKIRNMFNGTITGKGIAFKVETVDLTARYFIGDELRLTQVVTNLVSNASKFTPAGGRIEVTFKELDHIGGKVQLMIRVRDTGKGIAPENIRKIMKPFEQEEASTAHNYGGTGLGLALCDNIVHMMGGNIVVDSTLGKGSDFSVFLSLEVADVVQDLDNPLTAEEQKEDIDFTFEGCRILLAEDNEVNAEIAIEILKDEGAEVTHAWDGQEAVDIFSSNDANSFDLVLLDIQMPRLNGRDAAKAIRKLDRADATSVPIIALSADAFVEDMKLSIAAGMDGHVSKPIDFDDLRKTAGEIIKAKKNK